jgi:hypothetical protein
MLADLIPRLISLTLSWLDAGNLRTRVYTLQTRIDILETALEDIERMTDNEQIRRLIKQRIPNKY